MKTTQAYLFLTLVATSLSCTWIPKIDQQDYCYADYGIYFLVKSCRTIIINLFIPFLSSNLRYSIYFSWVLSTIRNVPPLFLSKKKSVFVQRSKRHQFEIHMRLNGFRFFFLNNYENLSKTIFTEIYSTSLSYKTQYKT